MGRIPFTVIGGFLGAGKTTLLRHWLSQAEGRRIAVLVNDFGAINIDADLVASAGADTIALSNGCVCCSIGDDLSQALLRVLAASPAFDAVVVEASGVSDPWRIAQFALADPQLRLQGVVVLLDTATLAAQRADPLLAETLERPLAHADLLVLNKADRAGAGDLAAARAWIAAEAAGRGATAAPVVETVQAELPLDWLGGDWYRPHGGGLGGGLGGGRAARAADHGRQFEAWQQAAPGLFDAGRLRAWLQALPPGVLRLKGLLATGLAADGAHSWTELQYAGRHASLRCLPAAPAARGGAPTAAVVAIGLAGQLPAVALAAGLLACQAGLQPP